MKNTLLIFMMGISSLISSQKLIHHTTNYFGPNANPVPDFTNATIPKYTQISVYGDYYFGHGDETVSNITKVEIPLVSEKISVKLWSTLLEHYSVTEKIQNRRGMEKGSGLATGDLYFQTRIKLMNEKGIRPAIILNATLKTASGSDFKNRRFFNTAGYYFDAELGKSFKFNSFFIDEFRFVGDVGFYSWDIQTPGLNVQDDAVMYGIKIIAKRKNLSWENTFSGYKGWITRVDDYGDRPMVFSTKLNFNSKDKTLWFVQYQHGIQYFPYEQIRLGVQFSFRRLTPSF